MDPEKLNALENVSIHEAKENAISMLNPKTKPVRLNRLKHDIQKATTSREVMRIMWNVYMSGTGYSVPTSEWQRQYRGS